MLSKKGRLEAIEMLKKYLAKKWSKYLARDIADAVYLHYIGAFDQKEMKK